VVKTEERLGRAIDKVRELKERYTQATLGDAATWTNQSLSFARAAGDMLELAEAMLISGKERRESRGSHYRTDYPERDDDNFWKHSIMEFDPDSRGHRLSWRDVNAPLVKPRARTYGKVDKQPSAAAT